MYRCECGKKMDGRGRKGHVRYSSGGEHGEKGELPDDWESIVPPLDDDEDADDVEDTDADDEPDEATDADVSEAVDDTDDDRAGRVRRGLFEDVRAFWGGDE
jgi:hypothetical protein